MWNLLCSWNILQIRLSLSCRVRYPISCCCCRIIHSVCFKNIFQWKNSNCWDICYSELICVCCRRFVWCLDFGVPPPAGRDGREWEFGRCAMFCWRLWTEGLREQLCRESKHPALYSTSPVIIEVIIEVVFWPLNPAALSGSHSAQCAVLMSFARHKGKLFIFCVGVYPLIAPATPFISLLFSLFFQKMISVH